MTDGLDRDEAIVAARSLLGIPEACIGDVDACLEQHAGRVVWKVEMLGSRPDEVEYHVLLDALDDTVVNWWCE